VNSACSLPRLAEVRRGGVVAVTEQPAHEVCERLQQLVGALGTAGDPDTPAPVRLLYDFDNLLLSHADRDRVSTPQFRRAFTSRVGPVPGAVLVDGVTTAHWTLVRERGAATLAVHPHRRLTDDEAAAVTAEAAGLLEFAAPGADREVRMAGR
jgi:hypothetical protein